MSHLKHMPNCECNACHPHLPEPFSNPTSRLYQGSAVHFYGITLVDRSWYVVTTEGDYFVADFWEGLPYA